jgi:anaerobic magnesium-protoporphyrin IX monomethyl ester cyclase
MRIAFLNPMFGVDFTKSARWFARSRGRVQRHPDYLCTAAATVEAAGHEVFFLDAQAKNLPTEAYLDRLRAFAPEWTVIQASTPSIDADIEAARAYKDATGTRTVLVGPHVSAEPEDTLLRAGDAVDAVALGEYDLTVRDLADGVAPEECPGLARRDGDRVVRNAPRPYVEDLDTLPFPAWQHIDLADYHDAGKLFPFLTLVSGRGCWGRCTFCQLPQVMNGRCYRARSIDNVIAEIEHDLALFPNLREIMFEDDALAAPSQQDRLRALCEALIRRRFGISWSANARVDANDLDTLRLMKRAGCRMLCVGFEFGDEDILRAVKKGVTVDEMRLFARNARKAGIRVHGCFMFGGPGETPETAQKTIDLACSLPIDTAQFSGVVAYPGTEYYTWARDSGYLVPGDWRGWVDDSFEQVTTQSLPGLSAEQINAFVDKGLRAFYLRPSQMARMLLRIRTLSDARAKLHGLRGFLGYFRSRAGRPGDGFYGNN